MALDSEFWCIGGYSQSGALSDVDIFDGRMGTWRKGPSLRNARGYAQACAYDGNILVFGETPVVSSEGSILMFGAWRGSHLCAPMAVNAAPLAEYGPFLPTMSVVFLHRLVLLSLQVQDKAWAANPEVRLAGADKWIPADIGRVPPMLFGQAVVLPAL